MKGLDHLPSKARQRELKFFRLKTKEASGRPYHKIPAGEVNKIDRNVLSGAQQQEAVGTNRNAGNQIPFKYGKNNTGTACAERL